MFATAENLPIYGLEPPQETDLIELQLFSKSELAEILVMGFDGSESERLKQIEAIRVRISRDAKLIYGDAVLDRELTYKQAFTLYCVAAFRLALKRARVSRIGARAIRGFINQPDQAIYKQIAQVGASPEQFQDRVKRFLLDKYSTPATTVKESFTNGSTTHE